MDAILSRLPVRHCRILKSRSILLARLKCLLNQKKYCMPVVHLRSKRGKGCAIPGSEALWCSVRVMGILFLMKLFLDTPHQSLRSGAGQAAFSHIFYETLS